jgi:hypothetical protein
MPEGDLYINSCHGWPIKRKGSIMKAWHTYVKILLAGMFLWTGLLQADILQPGFDQFQLAVINGTTSGATRAWGIGIADFNNDTIPDIIGAATDGDVRFYAGQGDGTFTGGSVVINQAYYNAFGLATADVNGDGNQDFILTMRDNYPTTPPHTINTGEVHLYLGNGNGSFQSSGFPQASLVVGDAGTASMAVAAGDVDGDTDIDIIAGDITASDNTYADVLLYRNLGNDINNHPIWSAGEVIEQGVDRGYSPIAEDPPYYPPKSASSLHAYGLSLGDLDGDGDLDLLLSDIGSYVYLYQNDGSGVFAPIPYNTISTGSRPYAMMRAHETFTARLPLACGDLNGDGLVDFVAGGDELSWDGAVDLWLNTGNDTNGWPRFQYSGIIGAAGTDALGVAIGNINPLEDTFLDVVFGNTETATSGAIYGLRADRSDTDHDGIIDLYDNAPLHANAPRLDMNDDGGINYLDQLDNDQDGVGDPADDDDDNDGVLDVTDNSPFVYNPDQLDTDEDGQGDVSDPLNNNDSDGDDVFDGPIDPNLYQKAMQARATWSKSDTHFIVRIDALGRVFQNEFTQTMTDAGILTPQEWELNRNYSYNGLGDGPADAGYQVPIDLPGGKNTPITLVTIPRRIWNAFGDTDPIRWMNERLPNPNLEIGQHGTYHANNTMKGDWADDPLINWYSCETCGFTIEEMFQYLRIGQRTLAGDYLDMWLQDGGADPETSPMVDWTNAANPLITYSPPFNASDTLSRDATAGLFYPAFSASIYEENSSVFTPEGSNHEQFSAFGTFHASADLQVTPELHGYATYEQYLQSIVQPNQLNTWLIEEVEWATRYCNDLDRLVNCPSAPGGINRENNMVDIERWDRWMTLLDFVNANGQPMIMGDYALAVAFDNAPTVQNLSQADSDHDGIGDVIDGAVLVADDVLFQWNAAFTEGTLSVTLSNSSVGIAAQSIRFLIDTDNDGTPESFDATTDIDGVASVFVQTLYAEGLYSYTAQWDAGVMLLSDTGQITVPCPLTADLTGDCRVRLDDFSILASQWQQSGDPGNCQLSADLTADDCSVTMADLIIMINEWLE